MTQAYTQPNYPHRAQANWRLKQSGFTLIELVLVLVLIGILGAVMVPRLMTGGQFEQRLQADKLVGMLREAQLRAMNDPKAVTENSETSRCAKVVITSTAFSVAKDCKTGLLDADVIEQQTSQGHFVGAENVNISVSGGTSTGVSLPLLLQFGEVAADEGFLSEGSLLGRPYINGSRLVKTLIITTGGKAVNIEPEGYIHGP